jgi:predicted kinase
MSKLLVLLRGLPGSGKSSFAKHMWSDFVICEADQFFYDSEGNYNFDPSKLRDAHKYCRDRVETFMSDNEKNPQFYPEIVVSNTFTREWEMDEYFKLAKKYDYQVVSLIVENRHGNKNIHGVPDSKIEEMRNRFEISL